VLVSPKKRGTVKKIVLAIVLLSTFAFGGGPSSAADYTINVHVSRTRAVFEGGHFQKLDVVIDGKRYELRSERISEALLALGDYKAKIVKDEHRTNYDSILLYEFLLPDNKTRRFKVVGQWE
jgi:hypothetical protein